MSVENAESVSSALWQDNKSLNELLKTTEISTHWTVIKLNNSHWEVITENVKSVSNNQKKITA